MSSQHNVYSILKSFGRNLLSGFSPILQIILIDTENFVKWSFCKQRFNIETKFTYLFIGKFEISSATPKESLTAYGVIKKKEQHTN